MGFQIQVLKTVKKLQKPVKPLDFFLPAGGDLNFLKSNRVTIFKKATVVCSCMSMHKNLISKCSTRAGVRGLGLWMTPNKGYSKHNTNA